MKARFGVNVHVSVILPIIKIPEHAPASPDRTRFDAIRRFRFEVQDTATAEEMLLEASRKVDLKVGDRVRRIVIWSVPYKPRLVDVIER